MGIPTGYHATISWSESLPGVVSTALSLFNFELLNSNTVLSYTAEFVSSTVTSAILQISPVGLNISVNYLALSVMVITDASSIL